LTGQLKLLNSVWVLLKAWQGCGSRERQVSLARQETLLIRWVKLLNKDLAQTNRLQTQWLRLRLKSLAQLKTLQGCGSKERQANSDLPDKWQTFCGKMLKRGLEPGSKPLTL
jgi:hypothetical protein